MSGRGTALTAASIANADVSARGRSRWWDRSPSRYSRHLGAAINRRTSHKSRLLGARTSHQSRGAAPMISVANADVSARGRSRWWDRAPCRYSQGDHRISQRENEMEIHVITFFNTFMVEKWSLTLGFIKTKEGYISYMQFSAATAHGSKDSFSYQFSSINLTKCTYH